MENIFYRLRIINDLSKIVMKYLTKSQYILLNGELNSINMTQN